MGFHKIEQYWIKFHGKRREGRYTDKIRAEVDLIVGNDSVGKIYFQKDGTELEPAKQYSDNGPIVMYCYISELPQILDTIRNEKPCYIIYNWPDDTYLSTGPEPPPE